MWKSQMYAQNRLVNVNKWRLSCSIISPVNLHHGSLQSRYNNSRELPTVMQRCLVNFYVASRKSASRTTVVGFARLLPAWLKHLPFFTGINSANTDPLFVSEIRPLNVSARTIPKFYRIHRSQKLDSQVILVYSEVTMFLYLFFRNYMQWTLKRTRKLSLIQSTTPCLLFE